MSADVCVVGAGPAGLAAAAVLARHGRSVVVVDESPEPGGRLLGQLHRIGQRNDDFHQDGWWNGRRIAATLAEDAVKAGATLLQGASVWGIYPGWNVCLSGERPRIIEASQLVLATGATEIPVPIPGWMLPGVMTIGAGQVMATQYRVRPGKHGIVVGINPLSVAIAHELQMAGTELAAIVNLPPTPLVPGDTSPATVIAELARSAHLAPSRLLRLAGPLGRVPQLAHLAARLQPRGGIPVWGIPLDPRRTVTAISGSQSVESVVVADLTAQGEICRTQELPVDSVFLAGGLRPLSELAMVTGCRMIAAPDLGGTVPLYGPGLETTAPSVHVAGNITGIESAIVAIAQGQLAATAMVAPDRVPEQRRLVARARREAPITFLPRLRDGRRTVARVWRGEELCGNGVDAQPPTWIAHSLEALPGDLTVCRCEGVRLDAVRRVAAQGLTSAEEIKRFTRMTMGNCQGRVCQSILEQIALAYGDVPATAPFPGHRPPVRPVALGDLATLAGGNEEWERLHGSLLPSLPFDAAPGERLGDPRDEMQSVTR
jgi:sarcosine oxidase subunit alpha